MVTRVRVKRPTGSNPAEVEVDEKAPDAERPAHEYTESVLADIDAALEGFEEDFARKFVQRGGE